MLTLTGKSRWLLLALCLSLAAALFAACGSEEPTSTPTTAPTAAPTTAPQPTAPAAATEATQDTMAPTATEEPPRMMVEVGNQPGQMAPDFDLTTVEGAQVSLSSLQGQPTVIYFFATW